MAIILGYVRIEDLHPNVQTRVFILYFSRVSLFSMNRGGDGFVLSKIVDQNP